MKVGNVKFAGFNCAVKKTQYGNGRPALQLIDIEDGAPVAVATVNIPNIDLAPNEVLIKNYSENEGILDVLVRAGVVKETGRYAQSGYVDIPVCKLLV